MEGIEWPRCYLCRCDLKLQILAVMGKDADAVMIQVAQGFWAKVHETEGKGVLVPWAEVSIGQHLLVTKMAEFPKSLANFRMFFMGATQVSGRGNLHVNSHGT